MPDILSMLWYAPCRFLARLIFVDCCVMPSTLEMYPGRVDGTYVDVIFICSFIFTIRWLWTVGAMNDGDSHILTEYLCVGINSFMWPFSRLDWRDTNPSMFIMILGQPYDSCKAYGIKELLNDISEKFSAQSQKSIDVMKEFIVYKKIDWY